MIAIHPIWRIIVDNTLECAGGKRIVVGLTALIMVLSTWVGFVSLMVLRRLNGMKKPEGFY
jgi:hypothetical protein